MIYKITKENNKFEKATPTDILRMSREILMARNTIMETLTEQGVLVGDSIILLNDATQAGRRHLDAIRTRR